MLKQGSQPGSPPATLSLQHLLSTKPRASPAQNPQEPMSPLTLHTTHPSPSSSRALGRLSFPSHVLSPLEKLYVINLNSDGRGSLRVT